MIGAGVKTGYEQCLRRCEDLARLYEDLYAQVELLAKGELCGVRVEMEFAPEGSCLAFLRWEELRRSEELRRNAAENGLHRLLQRRLSRARLDGFSDAVAHLAKFKLAYLPAEASEIVDDKATAGPSLDKERLARDDSEEFGANLYAGS